ncbi:MAG TPA: vWA domain-containing protein, partial [Phycisphaerae bacterium]|nr:vWA domain-containing protein [Phycisphaerae bacterium]
EAGGARGRADRYQYALRAVSWELPDLEKDFRVVWYHYARRPQSADSLDSLVRLVPAGEDSWYTDTRKALLALRQDLKPGEPAAVLLVTDGVYNPAEGDADARELISAAERLRAPIYAASVGADQPPAQQARNVRIDNVLLSPPVVVKDNVAKVKVSLAVAGLPQATVKVSLYEGDDEKAADSDEVRSADDQAALEAELEWTPRERPDAAVPDVRRLRIEASQQPGESETSDNAAQVNVLVAQPSIRLLYVEGSMRSEYRYLKRLLDTDANIRLMAMVRVRGNEFSAYGSLDGRTLSSLPAGADDFKLFDVLVIGDLDRSFFTGDQMRRIRQFVEGGGGLLMLGGHSSFGPGGFGGTEVEQAMPVVLGGRDQPQEFTPFVPRLTAMGQTHAVLEGLAGHFITPDGAEPLGELRPPELSGCVTVVRSKPAADVLLVHPSRTNENGPLVVLAVQQYRRGRAAAFTADTTWKWFAESRRRGGEGPYERFWGQLVRYLAKADTKSRGAAPSVLLQLTPSRTAFEPGEQITVDAVFRGAQADEATAEVTCRLIPAAGQPQMLTMKPAGQQGRFQASFTADKPGRFRLEAAAADKNGKVLASDRLPLITTGIKDAGLASETDPLKLKPDRKLLGLIAEASGGQHRDISELAELVRQMRSRLSLAAEQAGSRPRTIVYPRYGSGMMSALFVVFVALLTCEWLVRRNWQLR